MLAVRSGLPMNLVVGPTFEKMLEFLLGLVGYPEEDLVLLPWAHLVANDPPRKKISIKMLAIQIHSNYLPETRKYQSHCWVRRIQSSLVAYFAKVADTVVE